MIIKYSCIYNYYLSVISFIYTHLHHNICSYFITNEKKFKKKNSIIINLCKFFVNIYGKIFQSIKKMK
ncbi:hypothetical protein PFMALIP_01930 [Plasmodium falciparum MaliPS096_E11]|uniref:Uncharacterized protein n=1 Tax=Plasmodium falciparum MaliPS096_E11 TaxID=1036727 RepID=A0A024WSA1_PLAFA|nr:hypothetical protein PFMALIP_01930 [Plasmodium falciparum MaliPS096_E11]